MGDDDDVAEEFDLDKETTRVESFTTMMLALVPLIQGVTHFTRTFPLAGTEKCKVTHTTEVGSRICAAFYRLGKLTRAFGPVIEELSAIGTIVLADAPGPTKGRPS